jgi:uncharacterized repeat protein (TIGR02543 family)
MRAAPVAVVLAVLAFLLGAPASAGPLQQRATVLQVAVVGQGHVTSDDGQIACPPDCTGTYPLVEVIPTVTLTADPDAGWTFTGWSGDCAGTGQCVVVMDENHSVTATFAPETRDLTVEVKGEGTVTSDDGRIACPPDCTGTYSLGEGVPTVTLTADPDAGSTFTGWSGDCTGTGECVVVMDENHSVTATFAPEITELTVEIDKGEGTVTSDDGQIDCPPDCTGIYAIGRGGPQKVKLSPHPAEGWVFESWNHDCGGNSSCQVVMDQDHFVTARFERKQEHPRQPPTPTTTEATFVLSVTVVGDGSVASSPGGISCGGDCSETYPEHATVGLVPLPGAGSQFVSWSGDCSGSGACRVTMDGPRHVTATFRPRNTPPDEIGNPTNPIDEKGIVGDKSSLTFVFQCLSPEELWLDEVFVGLLHREIDQGSLDLYFPRFTAGLSRTDAALEVLHSLEYRTLLVQGYYMSFLHRSATPTELAFWLSMLGGGATDEQVAAGILGSTEYFSTRGGGTNAGFITALYQDLLGRAPTAAEQAAWDTLFGMGATREQVALQVLQSVEFRTRLIQGWFQAYLGRAPTAVELNFYLGRFAAGATDEEIQAAILGSDEFFGKVEDYKATIDWGDGTTTEVIVKHTTNHGRDCLVEGTHVFPTPGNKPILVVVTDPDDHDQTFRGLMRIQLPPVPPPGKENVQPFGTVLINVNGRFVPLTNFRQVVLGTELDTTKGRVRLTSPDGSTGTFFEGRFKILRVFETVGGKKTAFTLILLSAPLTECAKRTTSGATGNAQRPGKKVIRHVWGNTKGKFRTRGKYASATVRGTLWETLDYCDGTLVIVRSGRVDVFDVVKKVHHFITGGRSFFVPAP